LCDVSFISLLGLNYVDTIFIAASVICDPMRVLPSIMYCKELYIFWHIFYKYSFCYIIELFVRVMLV